ncbi:MAG: hypothetical protein NSGCLCUN01_03832 [uncultured Clostridium sp.]
MEHGTNENSIKEIVNQEVANDIHDEIGHKQIVESDELRPIKRSSIRAVRQSFSGPLPHPSVLSGYDKVCPGAADRIIQMAEKQIVHRHEMESSFLKAHSRNSWLGIIFAFILGIVITVGGIICVLNDKQISGLIFGGTGLASVIFAFINGTRMTARTREIACDKDDSNET